jgi:hypothetical protein
MSGEEECSTIIYAKGKKHFTSKQFTRIMMTFDIVIKRDFSKKS